MLLHRYVRLQNHRKQLISKCRRKRSRNVSLFLIYRKFIEIIFTGTGYGFNENWQFYASCHDTQDSEIKVPKFMTTDEIYHFHLSERNLRSVTLRCKHIRSSRFEVSLRCGFLFLCMLTLLSVLFRLFQCIFVYCERMYVRERFCMILFMHDADGRKRIS